MAGGGWLYKKGGGKGKERNIFKGGRRNWKKRWFVLEGNTLTYYESEPHKGDGVELGHVNLELLSQLDRTTTKETERQFSFALRTSDRDLLVAAETENDLNYWFLAIAWRKAVLDFLSLSPGEQAGFTRAQSVDTSISTYQIGILCLMKNRTWTKLLVYVRHGSIAFGSSTTTLPEEVALLGWRVVEEEQQDGSSLRPFCFGVFPPANTKADALHFSAASQEEMEAWMQRITDATCATPIERPEPEAVTKSTPTHKSTPPSSVKDSDILKNTEEAKTESQAALPPSSPFWGQSLSDMVESSLNASLEIPLVVHRCCSFIRENKGSFSDDVDQEVVDAFKSEYLKGQAIESPLPSVAVAAQLLKEFLQDLPEPLFPYDLYSSLCAVPEGDVAQLKTLTDKLPETAFAVASTILCLFASVTKNAPLDVLDDIAEGFAPAVLRPPGASKTSASTQAVSVIRTAIRSAETLFPDHDSEAEDILELMDEKLFRMRVKESTNAAVSAMTQLLCMKINADYSVVQNARCSRGESMLDANSGVDDPVEFGSKAERLAYQAEIKEKSEKELSEATDIMLNPVNEAGIPEVKCGTVDRLVERLTYEYYPDNFFLFVFLLTYRSFTNPSELLKKLMDRFNIAPPPDEPPSRHRYFIEYKQKPIRLRVVNVLRQWIDKYFYRDDFDKEMKQEFFAFVDVMVAGAGLTTAAKQLSQSMTKKLSRDGHSATRDAQFSNKAPPSILPAHLSADNIQFAALDDQEIARQLTLIESELYRRIQTKECLGQAWNKKTRLTIAPNITAMVEWFNKVSRWVAVTILTPEDLKDRRNMMEKFINIADRCRQLNNYNAVIEIVSGLHNSAVHRIKKTWEALPKRTMELYHSMDVLMAYEHNYKDYRENLKKQNPPIVPYLGVCLTDLTFIEDGNPDTVNDGLISFAKRQKLAIVIRDIQQYQQLPYNLKPVEEIKQFLTAACNECFSFTEDMMYKRSLEREPRT